MIALFRGPFRFVRFPTSGGPVLWAFWKLRSLARANAFGE